MKSSLLFNSQSAPEHARLLLVEDHALVARATRLTIERHTHFQIDAATTAEAAVELAKQRHYEVVLLDLGLPDHDGLWVAKQLRAESQSSVIIAVSAHMNSALRETCLQAGMQEALTKPLTLRMIQRYLTIS